VDPRDPQLPHRRDGQAEPAGIDPIPDVGDATEPGHDVAAERLEVVLVGSELEASVAREHIECDPAVGVEPAALVAHERRHLAPRSSARTTSTGA
jgi:hypothetical protein